MSYISNFLLVFPILRFLRAKYMVAERHLFVLKTFTELQLQAEPRPIQDGETNPL